MQIIKHWQVAESAKKEGRKAFSEMITYLTEHDNIQIAVIEKIDRVARNFADIVKVYDLIKAGKEFHFIKEGIILNNDSRSNELMNFDLQAVMAKGYINNLRDDVKKGLEEKVAQGGWPASAPLGYKNNKDTHTCDIDISKAPFVKKMFELYATGEYSFQTIGELLLEEGLHAKGKPEVPLCKEKIRVTLQNPFYIGIMKWKGKEYKAIHEPIISEELYYKVQDILRSRKKPNKRKNSFLFSGLIKCGVCGSSYTTEIQKGRYVYYRCTEHKMKHKHQYWREEKLNTEIESVLSSMKIPTEIFEVLKQTLKDAHQHEAEFHNQAMTILQTKLTKTQSRKDQLYDDRLDGIITKEVYLEKYDKEVKTEKQIICDMEKHKQANQIYFETGMRILELTQNASQLYKRADDEGKREIINFVFSNLTITNEKLSYTGKSPFDNFLNFNDRPNWSG